MDRAASAGEGCHEIRREVRVLRSDHEVARCNHNPGHLSAKIEKQLSKWPHRSQAMAESACVVTPGPDVADLIVRDEHAVPGDLREGHARRW